MGTQEEGHTGLGPRAGGGSEARGPDREPSAGAQAAAEPSAAGSGTAPARPTMNSGREPRTPRTLLSIADILAPGMVPRAPSAPQLPESGPGPTSPLCALEELTSKTFRGLDARAPQPSEGIEPARSRTLTWPFPHLSPPGSPSQTFVPPQATHPNPSPVLSPHARTRTCDFSPLFR